MTGDVRTKPPSVTEPPRARLAANSLVTHGLRSVTAAVDLVPPRVRFGHLQKLLRLFAVRGGLPTLSAPTMSETMPVAAASEDASDRDAVRPDHSYRCLLVAGSLDTGGVEAVVAMLAEGLPRLGISPIVACNHAGRTAQALRRGGVDVREAADGAALAALIRDIEPDVIQLHRPDAELASTVRESARSTVTVFHAIETYLDGATWEQISSLVTRQPKVIAVSASVKDFLRDKLPVSGTDIQVIVNGTPAPPPSRCLERVEARRRVGEALGCDLGDDKLVVSLSRFSDQKNVPGLVDAFLGAVEEEPRLRLIIAGEPENWLEVRRAEALRRGHPSGARVHLLATSDSGVLLSAADVFALDSLAEGGPLAAVEAAAHGLPLVLSDVGFARQLVSADGIAGVVVRRANEQMTPSSLARARRRRHQRNRSELSRAIVAMAGCDRTPSRIPAQFSEAEMVARHAHALKLAVDPSGKS